jgi:hypothetical protein
VENEETQNEMNLYANIDEDELEEYLKVKDEQI